MADPGHRERGLKAAIKNPRVSEEAKQRDREILENDADEIVLCSAGGYKAAINNPHVSEKAKDRDRRKLHDMGEI
ncbi:hypothetical protein B0T26DRAFT_638555 [Lasiosphaeria miniovina]|uniref:Uncharacterized protein n=1 Tax=Lasiosphaeria miniovina TaxID=1954250 RepID=A0AA40B517_9PEZI|nr:uncharacterized protein B0T26DRAFT_638555 [Lasiosphaeria miniovina]KAK0727682.1 hypothetical protein B0T26DRAFT_638555 [Lasiosphaeria miniovina]